MSPATPDAPAENVTEWRDVSSLRAWANKLVSHGGMNRSVGLSVIEQLNACPDRQVAVEPIAEVDRAVRRPIQDQSW